MNDSRTGRSCPVCAAQDSSVVLSLASTPLGDALSPSRAVARALPLYPLDLATCDTCHHAFLPVAVSPHESYSNYAFTTGASPGLGDVMRSLALELWSRAGGLPGDVAIDLGSNDGTFLDAFAALGAKVVGVEPSTLHARLAGERGIETINAYFSPEVAGALKARRQAPKVITIHNVFANVADPADFLRGVAELCDDGTLVSIVTGYHPDQFAAQMFDYVYHEHLSYFTMHDIVKLADACGLRVVTARRIALKGGSLQVLLQRAREGVSHEPEVENLVAWERWSGVNTQSSWRRLSRGIADSKAWLRESLAQVANQHLWGYGCSHSVTTLMYEFQIAGRLKGLVDDNPERHGKFAPGSGLRIGDPLLLGGSGDAVVILAWQHDWRIRVRLASLLHKGPVIQFMPRPTEVERRPE